jgi:AAA15 family ATPase/GTPase
MIKEIQLKNFKAFGEAEVTATFAPITLICGQNSAGKSSLIQSLLMLAQTMQSGDSNSESSDLVTNGKYIDLGNFNSLINNHDATKKLGVTIKFLKIRRDSVNLKSYEKDEFIPKISLIFETLNQKLNYLIMYHISFIPVVQSGRVLKVFSKLQGMQQ